MPNTPLYGFYDLEHAFDERVTEVGVEQVQNAIQASVEEHNRQLDALMSLFVEKTTDFKTVYKTTTVTRNQPLDQDGRARPIQPTGQYEVAFPIQGSGNAWGSNHISRVKMTVGDANRITTTLLEGDIRWMRDHVLAALYANTPWIHNDEQWENHGLLTIKGLANGDTDEYHLVTGADQTATDNHYKAQANAISDADDPFEADRDELLEHPENQGAVIALIPTNLRASVRSLSAYLPLQDDNVQPGSGTDVLTGSLGVPVPGEVFGYHDSGVWLVEWKAMPNDYIIMLTSDGEPVLRQREFAEAELQGFRQMAVREDHPFWESQFARFAGFGAWNRVGAVVRRIGNATYAVPTNYTSPMP